MSSPSLTHALLSLAAATLLLVSLSTPFCRANPVGWPPIAPINVSGRRVYPYAGGRQTFQSYPVSINVVPGSGGGFQQEDPFKMMGGGGNDPTGQFGAHGIINPMNPVHVMSPESGMNTFGLQNPMNPSFGPMGPFGAQGPNTFGGSQGQMNTFGSQPSPFYRPSPFGPPQMGSSNSIVGPMFQAAHVSEITQHTDDQPIPKTPSSAEQPGPPQPPGQQSEGLPGMPGAPTPSGNQAKLPPFLEGTSKSVQNRFFEIVQNRNDPYDDKQKKLDELIDQLDDSHKTQYNEFVEAKAKEEEEKRQKVHTIVATMSDEAQTQFAKISTLLRNPNIGDAERWQKVQGIYESMTPKLKEEFEAKFTAYG